MYYSELQQVSGKGAEAEGGDDSDHEVFEDARDHHEEEDGQDEGKADGEVPPITQEDKPKLSIVVELMANGYILNDKIIDKAKEFDGQARALVFLFCVPIFQLTFHFCCFVLQSKRGSLTSSRTTSLPCTTRGTS